MCGVEGNSVGVVSLRNMLFDMLCGVVRRLVACVLRFAGHVEPRGSNALGACAAGFGGLTVIV
jgi:hypothetical protein